MPFSSLLEAKNGLIGLGLHNFVSPVTRISVPVIKLAQSDAETELYAISRFCLFITGANLSVYKASGSDCSLVS